MGFRNAAFQNSNWAAYTEFIELSTFFAYGHMTKILMVTIHLNESQFEQITFIC